MNRLQALSLTRLATPSGLLPLIALAPFILAIQPITTLAKEAPHPRWAIISAPEVHKSGLSDLLTVELSQMKTIDLVERERLDAATRELELSALSTAEAAAGRLKLGRVLGADVLVLLSRATRSPGSPDGSRQFIKLVLCDCTSGARLRVEYLPADDDAARVAEKIGAIARQVRSQFQDGLRALLGVPPFVSRNLSHEFDRLQIGYAEITQAALSSHPGVAVIEIEEARTIARELARTTAEIDQVPAALFVEGEFTMSTLALTEDTEVQLAIRITDGRSPQRRLPPDSFAPEQAVRYLSETLPGEVLRLVFEEAGDLPGSDEQFRLLTARAEMFAALGDYRRSTDLRSAALLLQPDHAEQKLLSIVETTRLLMPLTWDHSDQSRGTGHTRTQADQRDCQARWRWTLRQVESVIRLRQVNPREAHVLVCKSREAADHLAGIGPEPWRKETWPVFAQVGDSWRQPKPPEVRKRLDQFFRQVYPLFPQLDPAIESGTIRELLVPAVLTGYRRTDDSDAVMSECRKPMTASAQYALWSGAMLWNVRAAAGTSFCSYGTTQDQTLSDGVLHGGRHYDTRYYDDTAFWLLTNVELQPFSIHPFKNNKCMTPDYRLRIAGIPAISFPAPESGLKRYPLQEDEQHRTKLVARLEGSGRPDLEFLAKSMRLLDGFEQTRKEGTRELSPQEWTARLDSLDKQISELAEWVKANGYRSTQPPPAWDPLLGLQSCRSDIDRYRKFVGATSRPGYKPVDLRRPRRPAGEIRPAPGDELAFEAIETIEEDCRQLIHCGDWDVIHNGHAFSDHKLFGIRNDGRAEPLYALQRRDYIVAVKYDGQGVWLATLHDGIRVLDEQGRSIATWSKDNGLPEYDRRLILYPLAPGRSLVIGMQQAEGLAPRNWFAVLDCGEGRAAPIRMVYTATKVADSTDAADQGFVPIWVAPWHDAKQSQKPQLLVGRCNAPSTRVPDQWQRRPLIVDLDTFQVRVSDGRFPAINLGRGSYEFATLEGPRVFIGGGSRVHIIEPPSSGEDRWTWHSIPPREVLKGPRRSPMEGTSRVPISPLTTIQWQGCLISRTAGGWWCFDRESEELEKLACKTAPVPLGVSAHYGVVAWWNGRLLRIKEGT